MSSKPADFLSPRPFETYSDESLYSLFVKRRWDSLDQADRLAALQEVENRIALREGREPFPVVAKELESPENLGRFDHEQIVLNQLFIDNSSMFHTPAGALETLLHEARHAYQVGKINEALGQEAIAQKVLLEWLANTQAYASGSNRRLDYNRYAIQSLEMDARLHSLQRLMEIAETLKGLGEDTRGFEHTMLQALQSEIFLIQEVRKHLTVEMLDQWSEQIIQEMEKHHPDIDFSQLTFFEEARLMLSVPSLNTIKDFYDLIALMMKQRMDKLSALDNSGLNKLADSLADKIQGDKQNCPITKLSPKLGRPGGKMRG